MIRCQKDNFSLPDRLHYLNCAYMSPMLRSVEEAGLEAIRRKRDPSTIEPEDFFSESDRVRALFGRIISAPAKSIAIVPSVSYGIATIARNVRVERGQTIVVLEEQFPSNVYVWRRLAAEKGAAVRTVGPEGIREFPTGEPIRPAAAHAGQASERQAEPNAHRAADANRAADWNGHILEAIDERTAVVAIPHVHWTDGTLFDLESISEKVRTVGAALVIDGTQSVGALPFDVGRIRPDALVCAGYKWLFGPYSIGVAYFAERHHDGIPLEENWITRRRSEEFSALVDYESDYQAGAIRFDVGERSNFILVPMLAAALEQVAEWGAEEIQDYCRKLMSNLFAEAEGLGYRIEGEGGRAHHLFGIRMPEAVDAERLRNELTQRNVSVSVRGSAVRVAPHVYNDGHDVDALLDALRAAVQVSA